MNITKDPMRGGGLAGIIDPRGERIALVHPSTCAALVHHERYEKISRGGSSVMAAASWRLHRPDE